jgi:hypothetical protein
MGAIATAGGAQDNDGRAETKKRTSVLFAEL